MHALIVKVLATIALPMLAHGAALGHVRRQQDDVNPDVPLVNGEKPFNGAQVFGATIQFKKIAKQTEVAPISGVPGAKRTRIIYGPFTVRGAKDPKTIPGSFPSLDPGGTAYNFKMGPDFPRDITILLSDSDLLMSDFRKAVLDDQIYNHHNVIMQVVQTNPNIFTCDRGLKVDPAAVTNLFGGTATEKFTFNFTSPDPSKVKTGFYLPKNAVLQTMLDLVNLGETREFYTQTDFEYLPGKAAGYHSSRHIMMKPNVCGGVDGLQIKPPEGRTKFNVASDGVIMAEDGFITRARSHLHDGGDDIVLTVNDKQVCRSVVQYGGPGFEFKDAQGGVTQTINGVQECDSLITVKKGDRIKLVANYDLDKHPARAMGAAPPGATTDNGGFESHGHRSNFVDGGADQMAILFLYWAPASV